ALVALICTFGPISGAHLNPAVSLADAIEGGITLPEMLAYIAAQCTGGIGATIAAHLMFDLPFGTHPRPTREMEVLCCSASLWQASDFCALSGDARGCAQAYCRLRLPATSPQRTGSLLRHLSRIPP